MTFGELLLMALAVSMDALAVSLCAGCTLTAKHCFRDALKIAVCFGVFQALMPALGAWAGRTIRPWIVSLDHWAAFGLLTYLGLRMMLESRKPPAETPCAIAPQALLALGLATSLDALAAGLSMGVAAMTLPWACAFIGFVTFALCLPGVLLGRRAGRRFPQYAQLAGGLMLVAMGCRILWTHWVQGV